MKKKTPDKLNLQECENRDFYYFPLTLVFDILTASSRKQNPYIFTWVKVGHYIWATLLRQEGWHKPWWRWWFFICRIYVAFFYIEAMQITLSLYRWPIATTPSSQHCARDGWGAREVPRRLSWLPSRWLKVASLYGQRLSQVFYALVFLVGVVGNTLVIYVVVRFSKMHTVNQHRHSLATFMHYLL